MQGPELGAGAGVRRDRLRVPGVRDHEREPEDDRRDPVLDPDGGAAGRRAGGCGVAGVREVPRRGGEREDGGEQEEDREVSRGVAEDLEFRGRSGRCCGWEDSEHVEEC